MIAAIDATHMTVGIVAGPVVACAVMEAHRVIARSVRRFLLRRDLARLERTLTRSR